MAKGAEKSGLALIAKLRVGKEGSENEFHLSSKRSRFLSKSTTAGSRDLSPTRFRVSTLSALVIALISLACFAAIPLSASVLANHPERQEDLRVRFVPAQGNSTFTATTTAHTSSSSSTIVRATSNTTSTTTATSRSTTLKTTATVTMIENHTSSASINMTSSTTSVLTTNVTTTFITTNYTSITTGMTTANSTSRTVYTYISSTGVTFTTNSTVRTTTYNTSPIPGTSSNKTVQGSSWSYNNPSWAVNGSGQPVANLTVTPSLNFSAPASTNITSYQYNNAVCSGASSSGQVIVCGDVEVSTTSPSGAVNLLVGLAGTLLGGSSITTSVCNSVDVKVAAYIGGSWQSVTPDDVQLVTLAAGLVCQVTLTLLTSLLFGTPVAIIMAAPSSTTTTELPTSSLTTLGTLTASTSATTTPSQRAQQLPTAYFLAAAVAAVAVISAVLIAIRRRAPDNASATTMPDAGLGRPLP